jgi:formiminotetrahydrofolate cyclodeaminase
MTAYRLPKAGDDEKSRRAEAIQTSLRAATETPLACARACAQVIALSKRAGEQGYAGVVSDAGVGVLAANTALRSAALNVFINAPSLKDRSFAAAATAEIEKLLDDCARESELVFDLVRSRLD